MTIVKVCHRCKVYITVGESFQSKRREQEFETAHKGHPLGLMNDREIGPYSNVNTQFTGSEDQSKYGNDL